MSDPLPTFAHLRRLTDVGGLYEHALGTQIRREHGYCLDDAARALVVVCREGEQFGQYDDLRELYLRFVLSAQAPDGRFRNRRNEDLRWIDEATTEDCWGRALWGLGTAISHGLPAPLSGAALSAFELGARWRSPWPRAMAFAALGAADVLIARPGHEGARSLLRAAARSIGAVPEQTSWPWPEPRLTYANAALPDALLAAGSALGDASLVEDGIVGLGWLLDLQTRDGHLSVVPAGGRGQDDVGPGFDQQPIEVAVLADACARAYALTGQRRWARGIELAAAWFLGANDVGMPLIDADSGGGCDGLEHDGRNENQGAESTLALISTMQHSRSFARCA